MTFKPRVVEKLHAFVATPAYDGKVDTEYAQSLSDTAFCCPLYGVGITMMVTGNGAFIELARNIYVKKFLEMDEFKECSHLFFIDADIKFEARAFIGLLQSGLPICAGVYPRRQDPIDFPFMPYENPDGGGLWFVDDWLQCKRVPTGFLCISRKVLEEMAADAKKVHVHGHGDVPWVFYTKIQDGKFTGEDYAFCDDYIAKYGKPIPVWANFDFVHGKKWEGNLFKHLMEEKQKSEAQSSAA